VDVTHSFKKTKRKKKEKTRWQLVVATEWEEVQYIPSERKCRKPPILFGTERVINT
jgi:hypothetical protein